MQILILQVFIIIIVINYIMNKQLLYLIYIYGITGISLFIIVLIRTFYNKKSFVFRKYKLLNNFDCDLMCFSHFIMYVLLGYFAPNYPNNTYIIK